MLAVAVQAGELLISIVQEAPVAPVDVDRARTVAESQHLALWFMAIISFRALRAAIHVLSIGYEDQSFGYQRLIAELHGRAQKVRDDHSGDQARQWLAGRSLGKPAKLVGRDFYDMISGPVHANSRAVFEWLAISRADGSTGVVLGPERRPEVANAALVMMAGQARDIGMLLASRVGLHADISQLDEAIKAGHAAYLPGASS
jgi:hypothetical protein